MCSSGSRDDMSDRRVMVNNGKDKCEISADLAQDLRIEHYIEGESHPVPRYADEERTMSHSETMKQLNDEKNRLKNALAALKEERAPTVPASINEPAIAVEFHRDGSISFNQRLEVGSNIDTLSFYVDKKTRSVSI